MWGRGEEPSKEPEAGMNLACWDNSQEPGDWSTATERNVEGDETKGLMGGLTPAPSLSSISFLLPGALPGMQKDKDGGLKVLSSKDRRNPGVQTFHFIGEETEGPKGSGTFLEPQGSLSAELGREPSSEPLGHAVSPCTAQIRAQSSKSFELSQVLLTQMKKLRFPRPGGFVCMKKVRGRGKQGKCMPLGVCTSQASQGLTPAVIHHCAFPLHAEV